MLRTRIRAMLLAPPLLVAGAVAAASDVSVRGGSITEEVAAVGESAQEAADAHLGPSTEPGFEMERVGWLGAVRAGGTVTVRNPFGDVRARFGGYQGEVEVMAVLQHFAEEGARLTLEALESDDGVELVIGHRSQGGELVTTREPGQRKRADLVVFVPRGVKLEAVTDDGLLEARGLQGNVTGATRSGEIRVRAVEGVVELTTVSGPVLLALSDREVGAPQSVVSQSGDLTVYVSEDANLTIRVASDRPLGTDFTAALDHQAGRRPAATLATAVIGKGTDELRLESPGGIVRLLHRPAAGRARVRPGS
jgi:hypothetical protein